MKKIICLVLVFLNLTVFGESYLIIPKKTEILQKKEFLKKKKAFRNKLLTNEQRNKFDYFESILEVDEKQLEKLASEDYILIERITKLKIDNIATPNDPEYSKQWSMKNTNADKAWEFATGKGVIVAVVDTGIDYDHEDLEESLWINSAEDINGNNRFDPWPSDSIFDGRSGDIDGIDNDGNGFKDDVIGYDFIDQELINFGDYRIPDGDPFDEQDHGTTVAGLIAAKNNNEIGITGAAFDSKIMTLRAFDAGGEGESDDVARCIIYAALNGAKVINMSFGEQFRSPIVADAIEFAYSMGCVLVSSSGNSNNFRQHYPSDLPEVISCAGTNEENNKYGFSNYGGYIDIAAPGTDVLTTSRNNNYRRVNGTSFAAPFVSATAALLFEKDSDLSAKQIRSIIQNSSFDLGENGWDEDFGSGIVDMRKALQSNPNTVFDIDRSLFEQNFNKSTKKEISIKGSISIPLMTGFTVYLGKGHYPDRLSNNDKKTIVDSINRLDSIKASEEFRPPNPINTSDYDPSDQEIFDYKWDTVFTSKNRFIDEEIFKLDISQLEDTTYTLRFSVELFNGKKLDRRTKFYIYDPKSDLSIESSGFVNMLHNGKNRTVVYATSNKETVSEVRAGNYSEFKNDYATRAHSILLDENINATLANLKISRFGENSATINIPIESDSYEVPRETFKIVSINYPLAYLNNGVQDFDEDGNPEILLNDLNSLLIDSTIHYEYEQGNFVQKSQLNEVWLPTDYGDSDGDGLIETLTTAGFAYRLFEANEEGNPFAETILNNDQSFRWGEAMHDFDGDGLDEIVLKGDREYVLLSYKNGRYVELDSAIPPLDWRSFGVERRGVAGDFNRNGKSNLCLTNRLGHIMIFEYESEVDSLVLKQYFDETVSNSEQHLQALDINGDGVDEIISLNNGSSGIFGNVSSLDRFWRIRVYEATSGLYQKTIDKYIYGVQSGFLGNTGIVYRNGLSGGELNGKEGDELVVSTFPNLYVFTFDKGDLKPIWHLPNAISNSAVIHDFNGNGINELGVTNFAGFAFYEFDTSIELEAPSNFDGFPINSNSAELYWDVVSDASSYQIYSFTGEGNEIVLFEESNENQIELNNLQNEKLYRFVVRACNDETCSDFSSNIVEIFPHNPIEAVTAQINDPKNIILKYSGRLGFDDPEPNLFEIELNNESFSPAAVTRSSDSTIILQFDIPLENGTGSILAASFRDFYRTPTLNSKIELVIDFPKKESEVIIKSFEVQGSSLIGIEFSQEMEFGIDNPDNYLVEPFGRVLSVDTIPGESNKVQLILSSDAGYSRGREYILTAVNLFSIDSIPITKGPGATISFSFARDLLNSVYLYPHPVSRSTDEYFFANLTPSCKIIIMNNEGIALKELIENDGNGGVEWDGTDYRGNFLDPGIYFWKAIDEDLGHESELKKMFVK